jgi:hypothetical protein
MIASLIMPMLHNSNKVNVDASRSKGSLGWGVGRKKKVSTWAPEWLNRRLSTLGRNPKAVRVSSPDAEAETGRHQIVSSCCFNWFLRSTIFVHNQHIASHMAPYDETPHEARRSGA